MELVALYPLSSPNHNLTDVPLHRAVLRYILFHHQTTTYIQYIFSYSVALYPLSSPNHNKPLELPTPELLRYILFHHQTTTPMYHSFNAQPLRYILFHHQTTTYLATFTYRPGCVISSFITKPQLTLLLSLIVPVALYPLSSPNHNKRRAQSVTLTLRYILFHHQTTTITLVLLFLRVLRYILFHHQTTTKRDMLWTSTRCVISSFITKPQPKRAARSMALVALYPLSSPNHNLLLIVSVILTLRYILFHHQTTTQGPQARRPERLRYILFHHQTTTAVRGSVCRGMLRYILFHHQTTTASVLPGRRHPLRYILFHHQTTTGVRGSVCRGMLRYILFHHQTTTSC